GTVLLLCDPISETLPHGYGGPICPNQSPGISLTETFVKDESIYNPAGGFVRFRLLCQSGSCEPPDIYYLASMDATYHDQWNTRQIWSASLYTDARFTTPMVQGMPNGVCGVAASGSCHFEIAGVIPKEIISDSADWTNDYFDFYGHVSGQLGWGTHRHVEGVIQVSLDPRLLDLQMPSEAVSCKGVIIAPQQDLLLIRSTHIQAL
ncbi:MAG: hypothetical protein L0287_30965, partial [Anaerolineae bacterium]|nr:hypothetical protein [Anaerolineae bacterium]